MAATFRHCLENGRLGVGWRVNLANTTDWETYEREAIAEYGSHKSIQQPRYIKNNVKPGDLVWTRDPKAQYYLAQVESRWEYWTSEESRANNIDIANVFGCDFCPVELDEVPGVIVSSFGNRGRSIQRIWDSSALAYSKHRWNLCAQREVYDVDLADFPDFFAMLDSEETEDLVFVYLQRNGWYVIPNSRKGNTLRFEYMLTHSQTGEKALTQVKSGDTELNVDDYAEHQWRIFLFQSNELYDGRPRENVTCITRDEIANFLQGNIGLFPQSFQTKLNLIANGSSVTQED